MSLAALFRRTPRLRMTPTQLAAHLSSPPSDSSAAVPPPTASSSAPAPSDGEPIPGHPVVLPDLTKQWPTVTPEKLKGILGDSLVEVELGKRGRGYMDPAWQRVEMPFSFFLDYISQTPTPSSAPAPSSTPSPQSPPSLHPPSSHSPHTGPNAPDHASAVSSDATAGAMHLSAYLAQLPLPAALPLPALAHYTAAKGDVYGRTLWVGNASFTPFHRDPNHGLYTHLFGEKVFYLVPPEGGAHLAPAAGILRNTSRVPVPVSCLDAGEEMPDLEHPPAVYRGMVADAARGGYVARLGPGDSVLIPMGWWHSAEGLGLGIGVNAWFR